MGAGAAAHLERAHSMELGEGGDDAPLGEQVAAAGGEPIDRGARARQLQQHRVAQSRAAECERLEVRAAGGNGSAGAVADLGEGGDGWGESGMRVGWRVVKMAGRAEEWG